MRKSRPLHPSPHRAFSLVEVAIALAISTFAVVSVVGLLPVGLGTIRDSKAQMVETQILKAVAAQHVVGNFTNLEFTAWFDHEGQRLETASNAAYQAVVTGSSEAPVFPGSSNAFQLTSSLRATHVEITDLRTSAAKVTSLWVSQNGK